jgi:hypothetical protein
MKKFKVYESKKGLQELIVFQKGEFIQEFDSMDGVYKFLDETSKSVDGFTKSDTEEWPIVSSPEKAIYFLHTRIFVNDQIQTIGHILEIQMD